MFEEELEPLIQIMPNNNSLEAFHLHLRPSVYFDSMVVNGRLYTTKIQDHGQIITYLVHIDDGLYYAASRSGICDTIEDAKKEVGLLIKVYLRKPF